MENKFDISKIDKRILTGAAVAVVVVIALIIALIVGGNKPVGNDSTDTDTQTENQSGSDVESETGTDTEKTTEAGTETETGTEIETGTETETGTESESTTESEVPTESEQTSQKPDDSQNSESQKPDNSQNSESQKPDNPQNSESQKPDESQSSESQKPSDSEDDPVVEPSESEDPTGEGATADNPIFAFYGEDLSLTTEKIGAGKKLYYNIYRVGGMNMTINDANAYVVYDGKTYEAKNGVVTVKIGETLASHPVEFQIGNKGSKEASFKVQFSNPVGTYQNPVVLNTLEDSYEFYSEEGNATGCYYKYVAEKTGTLVLYVSSVEAKSKNTKAGIVATNNNTCAQRTTAESTADEDGYVKVELEVTEGDEVMIQVYVVPTLTWKYPAADVTWRILYK